MIIYVLDTNIISQFLRYNRKVRKHLESVTGTDSFILGCPVTKYEITRGLLKRDARNQMNDFMELANAIEWQNIIHEDWDLAAEWWTKRESSGRPIHDADLLIAVFSYRRNAILVTDNEKDFQGLDVQLENWTK